MTVKITEDLLTLSACEDRKGMVANASQRYREAVTEGTERQTGRNKQKDRQRQRG